MEVVKFVRRNVFLSEKFAVRGILRAFPVWNPGIEGIYYIYGHKFRIEYADLFFLITEREIIKIDS